MCQICSAYMKRQLTSDEVRANIAEASVEELSTHLYALLERIHQDDYEAARDHAADIRREDERLGD